MSSYKINWHETGSSTKLTRKNARVFTLSIHSIPSRFYASKHFFLIVPANLLGVETLKSLHFSGFVFPTKKR